MSNAQTAPGTPTAGSSSNVVGVHYKVGKKIGEGSFGVIFEGESRDWSGASLVALSVGRGGDLDTGKLMKSIVWLAGTNLLNSQTVAIKFVRLPWTEVRNILRVIDSSHFIIWITVGTSKVGCSSAQGRVPIVQDLVRMPYVSPLYSLARTSFVLILLETTRAPPQPVSLRSTILVKKVCTTSSSSTSWDPRWKTCSTCADASFL